MTVLGAGSRIPPLTPRNRKAWRSARTLADLGELVAQWLEGRLSQLPNYGSDGVDVDEHRAPGLTAALVAWNRAGFVTESSQAGYVGPALHCRPDEIWTQYAAVTGYADDATLDRLFDAVEGTRFGIWVWETTPGWSMVDSPLEDDDLLFVSFRGDWAVTSFGRGDTECIDLTYGGCHPKALAALREAWQVTVVDSEPGRNDLWPLLLEAAAR